jgi:hypothetical protein
LRYSRSRFFAFLFFVLKILGNGSGKNNKSCRIFHNENPTKLGLHFSVFVRFYMNFQIFSKSHVLFKTRFYWQVPVTSVSIANRSLVHEKHPGINERDAMGKGWERTRGLPTVDLWPQMGGGAPVVGRPAAHREHGRCELCSGGPPVWEEARVAPV